VTKSLQLVANQRNVAQASRLGGASGAAWAKPAVSPIFRLRGAPKRRSGATAAKSAGGRNLLAPRR